MFRFSRRSFIRARPSTARLAGGGESPLSVETQEDHTIKKHAFMLNFHNSMGAQWVPEKCSHRNGGRLTQG
jgi:hypothetical protein